MRRYPILVLITAFIALAACSSDDDNPVVPKTNQVLVPLAVGNEWRYTIEHFRDGDVDTAWSFVNRIDSVIMLNGEEWYVTETGSTIRNTPNGFHSNYSEGGRFIKFPAKVNDSFPSVRDNPYFFITTVLSTDTLITVPAGQFRCYRYSFVFDDAHVDTYYCPGVGNVRVEDKRPDIESAYVISLTSFHLVE